MSGQEQSVSFQFELPTTVEVLAEYLRGLSKKDKTILLPYVLDLKQDKFDAVLKDANDKGPDSVKKFMAMASCVRLIREALTDGA